MKAKLVSIYLFICLLGINAVKGFADNSDWPRWRGRNGDGISTETDWNPEALKDGAGILWNVHIGAGYSNVVIQDDHLYTMGIFDRKHTIYCLDAVTGEEIWKQYITEKYWEPRATPAVDGNQVYGLGADGTLVCLKAKDGVVLWKKHLLLDFKANWTSGGWTASPVVEGDLLLLNANTKQIALNRKTGELVWSIDDEKPNVSWGSFATTVLYNYDGKRCALILGPSMLNAVDIKTGKKLWSYKHGERQSPIHDPILYEDEVFLSLTKFCVMLEVTESGPKKLWGEKELTSSMQTFVLLDKYLYGVHWPSDSQITENDWNQVLQLNWPLRCIDVNTGKVMWEKNMKMASLTAANGKLIMLELDGMLRIADVSPSYFREISSLDVLAGAEKPRLFATHPVLAGGKIYCRSYAGDLVCIDVSK
jgi:outer membrane protein assembly factor BamB